VNVRLLASAACAALTVLFVPSPPAAFAQAPTALSQDLTGPRALSDFYASRGGAPLWFKAAGSGAASALIDVLRRGQLDNFPAGPTLAAQAQALLQRAQMGDAAAITAADRLLSGAWVQYVQALQTPPAGMTYADAWVTPRRDSAASILARAAAAPALAAHVKKVSAVNPIYAQLRDAAWQAMQANGQLDPRALASLERARDVPPQGKFVIVDTAGARLYMIDDGRIVDSMKVIVGRNDPSTQTPMLASTIYYATLNPYWHVSADMVRELIAPNVLNLGLSYLKTRGYQVMPADPNDNSLLDPAKINWRAIAAGRETVRVRQLPGPANSMGRLKIPFPNATDIYLHDTPSKALFSQDDRSLSHGCIRLEDAERLGRWLMGREPETTSREPEQNVLLPSPVPIYLTYLTAQVDGSGRLSFVDDRYRRDAQSVASLR
jgi:murein L,D-transpeptidase YcbB/YkuD